MRQTRVQTCFEESCASGDRKVAERMLSHFLYRSEDLGGYPLSVIRAAIKQYCQTFNTTPHEVIKREKASRAEWADMLAHAHHIPGLSL